MAAIVTSIPPLTYITSSAVLDDTAESITLTIDFDAQSFARCDVAECQEPTLPPVTAELHSSLPPGSGTGGRFVFCMQHLPSSMVLSLTAFNAQQP